VLVKLLARFLSPDCHGRLARVRLPPRSNG